MRAREKNGEMGREQSKNRVMDVLHIDFFSIQKKQKQEERV